MNKYYKKIRDKFRLKYPGVTDEDLKYSEGYESEMLAILGSKLGKTEMEILTILIDFY